MKTNTETHNWTMCREREALKHSALIGMSVKCPTQGLGIMKRRGWKDFKSHRGWMIPRKQCFPDMKGWTHSSQTLWQHTQDLYNSKPDGTPCAHAHASVPLFFNAYLLVVIFVFNPCWSFLFTCLLSSERGRGGRWRLRDILRDILREERRGERRVWSWKGREVGRIWEEMREKKPGLKYVV